MTGKPPCGPDRAAWINQMGHDLTGFDFARAECVGRDGGIDWGRHQVVLSERLTEPDYSR